MVGIPYETWSGAGNTFVLVEAALLREPIAPPDLARLACAAGRASAAAVDGLLLVSGDEVRLWNRDGSPAEFCGNGARCHAARLLQRSGSQRVRFLFGRHSIEGWREQGRIGVTVPPPCRARRQPTRAALGGALAPLEEDLARIGLIHAGVPHLCLLLRGPARSDLRRTAPALRQHPFFAPNGTNVTFLWQTGLWRQAPEGEVRTFERGVEDFTQACGSGAVAGAAMLMGQGSASRAQLRVASGDWLAVERNGPVWTLSGPASRVAEGLLSPDPGRRF
ncbi:MAG: diaminopimelate epimerase [Candidatus Eisenbacteria bacterium]|uniref:Diaminopimelate epimerase n=1 Tax=Eiseniibacteriota bacterium TaxID=2212470 RepID=A0A938BQH5_UNCEI|nr:diaminopimelate epimerase [Candidatus Eisenbacteria bacterium]